jgi:hypothetical protein
MEGASRLRPRDIGELIDETFALYRRNFALFAGVVAVVAVPQAILGLIAIAFHDTFFGGAALVLIFVTIAFYVVMIAALARVISRRYLNEPTTVPAAYRSIGWRIFFRLIGASALWILCVFVSAFFFLLPAIVISVYWLFIPQVIVLEGVTVADSLGRSWRLVQGSFWRTLGFALVVFIAYTLVEWGITEAAAFALSPLGTAGAVVGVLLSATISTLSLPFLLGATTLLYYDQRIRKEGFDLELLARDLAMRPQP